MARFVVWSSFNLLHNSLWITFPTQSSLVFHFFCVSFLHLIIMLNTFISITILPTLSSILLLLLLLIIIIIIIITIIIFLIHTSVSWLFSTGVWVTTSLLKSPGTLLSILADLNNAVVWMVSTRPLNSKSTSPCTKPLVTVPSTPDTTGITVVFMFHFFFQFSSKVQVLISLFAFFQFYSVASRDGKFLYLAGSFLCLDYHKVWSSGQV